MSRGLRPAFVALLGLLPCALPAAAAAQQSDTAAVRQQAEQRLGRGISQEEIIERLRASGMTRAQVRARLQAMGYDPALADPYFDAMRRGADAPEGRPNARIREAMDKLGVTQLPDSLLLLLPDSLRDRIPRDSVLAVLDSLLSDTLALDSLREGRLPIFGMSMFQNPRNQFQPTPYGPVGPGYTVGPGDELILILTGAVEDAYDLTVTREGFIVIPDAGRVFVSGLTLNQLEDRLYDVLGRVYSGVARGPEATTRFQVSLGELRMNQVYLVGEVQRPGSYQVSAVSSALNAMYQAGGPNATGSFRRVEVRRNGRLADVVDLYDYLLTGGSRAEEQLQDGDRVFIPVVGARVAIEGEVRRPARYEILPDETVRDLIAYAGGFGSQAVVRRVQIDRILPLGERRPGVDRVLVDVPLDALRPGAPSVPLRDGDRVTVFAISRERRSRLVLTGDVNRPGVYQWTPGLTLGELVERAEGLAESAYTQRAQVFRLNERDGTRTMIPAPLASDADGNAARLLLEDRDSVVVFSRAKLVALDSVAIRGFVKEPGSYAYAHGLTVQDLILAAGGFTPAANTVTAELARISGDAADTAARVFRVPIGDAPRSSAAPPGMAPAPEGTPPPVQVALLPGDRVFIQRAPAYVPVRYVIVTGEVHNPGMYAMSAREERLVSIIARAGGVRPEGYAPGLQLVRDSTLVGADLADALRDPRSPQNVTLMDGDSIHVPAYDPTVKVSGAVQFASRVVYVPGKKMDYYIEQAGGYAADADRRAVSVTYQNGEREMLRRQLMFNRRPAPGPGSEVFVPPVPEGVDVQDGGIDWGTLLMRTASVLGTVATVLLALNR